MTTAGQLRQSRALHRTAVELFILALQQVQLGYFGCASMAHDAADEMADAAVALLPDA